MKNFELLELTTSELRSVNGGGIARNLGRAWGDAMCGIKATLNVFYNYWSCGCIDSGC